MAESLSSVLGEIESLKSTVDHHEKRFALIAEAFDTFRAGISVINNQGALVLCNAPLIQALDLPDRLVKPGTPLNNLIDFIAQSGDITDANAIAALQQMTREARKPFELVRSDGSHIQVRRNDLGDGAYVLIFANVSIDKARERELSKALSEAESASRLKSQFLSTISHELRTPMNAIIGMTDLLLGTNLDDSQKEFAATIKESARALMTEINEILSVTDLESGRVRLNIADFSPRRVVEDVVNHLQNRAETKALPITLDIAENIPEKLIGDSKSVQTILANLLGNAIKFTEKGEVGLKVELEKSESRQVWLRFTVNDTGIGIQKEHAEALFTAFSQGDSSTSRRYGGIGIGLTLAKKMAEYLNGSIDFKSAYGEGSSFWVILPFTAKVALSPYQKALTDTKILVADDNDINRRVIGGLLDSASYQCTFVKNGKEALDAVESKQFAAILMDVEMPVMDGLEATRAIRALGANKNQIPIIAVTGHSYPEDIKRIQEAGLNDHLAKPIQRAALLEILTKWTKVDSAPTPTAKEKKKAEDLEKENIGRKIDQQTLKELKQALGHGVLRDLMQAFIEDAEIRRESIIKAADAGDHDLLEKECHSLQGASGNMGILGVSEYARSMVALCRSDEGDKAIAMTPRMVAYINDSITALGEMGYH